MPLDTPRTDWYDWDAEWNSTGLGTENMTNVLETNGRTPSRPWDSTVRSFCAPSPARMPGGAFFVEVNE